MSAVIKSLPPALRDRIAAGEVIQRPSNALKEMLENALDSGATEVTIRIANGGIDLVEVADNGSGIAVDQLGLAVENHATSKIATNDDLSAIMSFGFRGEALASLRAAGQLTIISRTGQSHDAWQLATTPDTAVSEPKPARRNQGTTVRLENLFGHWPARKKFLRSARSEIQAIRQIVDQYILANPEVHIHYWVDGKAIIHATSDTTQERVAQWLGSPFNEQILVIEEQGPLFAVQYFGALPRHQRGRASKLQVFVNRRPVNDKSLLHAVVEGQRRWLAPGTFPMGLLMIDVDPTWVDVNVHPAKTEVRFHEPRLLYDFVRKTIGFHVGQQVGQPTAPSIVDQTTDSSESNGRFQREDSRSGWPRETGTYRQPVTSSARAVIGVADRERSYDVFASTQSLQTSLSANTPTDIRILGQVAAKYIVAMVNGQIMTFDQHAAHEALNYERIRQSFENGISGSAQRLLLPLSLVLDEDAIAALANHADAASALGFEFGEVDATSISVTAVPDWSGIENEAFLAEWAEQLREDASDRPIGGLEHHAAERACKASIRANTRMSNEAMMALVQSTLALPAAAACPHGRPTSIEISEKMLDRLFLREGH